MTESPDDQFRETEEKRLALRMALAAILFGIAAFLSFCGAAHGAPPPLSPLLGEEGKREARGGDADDQGTLLLVREWDAKSGELAGWLPTHSMSMSFSTAETAQPQFDLNEAVTIVWLRRRQPPLSPLLDKEGSPGRGGGPSEGTPSRAPQASEGTPSRAPQASEGDVRVSPEPREFEGEKWVPVLRDSNLVRIRKCLFLIRGIILDDSSRRMPAIQK